MLLPLDWLEERLSDLPAADVLGERLNLPLARRLKRLAAARLVLIFGMMRLVFSRSIRCRG
jgi:hypothetical protein